MKAWLQTFFLTLGAGLKALEKMPYRWAWICIMICSAVLFSWWDDFLVWTIGVAWNPYIIPIYYIIEYGLLLPLTLLLAKKTYARLNVKVDMREVLKQSLKNSLPVVIYRKLKRLKK